MDCGRAPFSATTMTFGPPRFGQRRRNHGAPSSIRSWDACVPQPDTPGAPATRTRGMKSFPIRTFRRGRPWHIP